MCLNLWNGTQVQLDCLDGLVLSKTLNVLYYYKSRNDMKAVETMEIKGLIVSKSTSKSTLLIKWPQ